MNLYQIDAAMAAAIERAVMTVDPETGELAPEAREELDMLVAAREDKIEGTALYLKNLKAAIADIRAEEKELARRRKIKENAAERLESYLLDGMLMLGSQRFETARADVRVRSTNRVEIVDAALIPQHYLRIKTTVEPDKAAIKDALKTGEVPGAKMETGWSVNVK